MNVEGASNVDNNSLQSNHGTVLPLTSEFTRNRLYPKKPEYVVDQYSEYPVRKKEDYMTVGDLSSSQGTLYSVSQRVPPVSASYSSLCASDAASAYGTEQKSYSALTNEWEHERTVSTEIQKEGCSEEISDKHNSDSIASVSLPNSIGSGVSSCTNNEYHQQGPIIPTCVYMHNNTAFLMEVDDTPTAPCELLSQAIVNYEELGFNKQLATQVFTLWMSSPLLEIQLKPSQKPYEIRKIWRALLEKYSHVSYNRQQRDEPKIMFQRNVFFPLNIEEKIKDPKILELLYEEAKYNIVQGRYPCEVAHYIMLGGVQAHIELGPYNPQVHSTHYFREEQSKYLPSHVCKSATWTWLPISYKNSPEVRLLEHFKRVPASATNRKLMKKYLEFCWTLPFYGAAFFEGQIEQPVRGLMSLITYQDIPVLVAINSTNVYVIDDLQCVVLLGLRYEEFSWEYASPSIEDDPNCLHCLFLQFVIVENGARVSKILQIFSRQASLMDALISYFVNSSKQKSNDETDHKSADHQVNTETETHSSLTIYPHSASAVTSLSTKLSRLTLATFDENGHCIGQMGSWSFTY